MSGCAGNRVVTDAVVVCNHQIVNVNVDAMLNVAA